jgi:hypothetical protein
MFKMPTMEQIQHMTPQELAALNKKLIKRLIITRIVVPTAIIAAVHLAAKAWESKQDAQSEN